ncbi:MAG: GumC family protein [Congregibacter sp.]
MVLSRETPQASFVDDASFSRARRKVFVLVAGLILLVGLVYTAFQPSLYRSSATVLMSAPTAIDRKMEAADVQGVAIQRRTLTGREITTTLQEELSTIGIGLDPLALRTMLDVTPIAATNLLELSATGSDKNILAPLVESWIEVYTRARADDIDARKSSTLREVQDELDGLQGRLEAARSALDEYRATHEIISMERQENAVLSRLDGLNKAFNNAVEAEVKAQSKLETLRASLAAGEQVVPKGDRREVADMAKRLADLRARLSALRSKYTDDYIRKDPRLREIPEKVDELEETLTNAYALGTQAELVNSEREYRAARQTVADLERRLEDHKESVSEFNTIYATHQALVADLSKLEQLNRETQSRLVQIEVRQVEKYPQVSVVDWPTAEPQRVGPPYTLLLGGTITGAFVLGVLAVWLYSYLHPRPAQAAMVTLTGVHMYPQDGTAALGQVTEMQGRLQSANAPLIADESGSNAPGAETNNPDAASDDSNDEDPDPKASD